MQNLGKKLQLKTEQEVLLLNAPAGFTELLIAEGYTIAHSEDEGATAKYKAVQLFVKTKTELENWASRAVASLQDGGILWVAYPKKTSGIVSDLTRDEGWKVMAEAGFEAVRQVSLDDTWSSIRFRQQQERKKPSTFGIDLLGIDRIAKTVALPIDMHEALNTAGLLERFEKLAFTHRKEYVVAVLQAKRPETRINRIQKTVQALASMDGK